MTVYGLLTDNIDAMIYGNLVKRDNTKDGSGTKSSGSEGDVYNLMGKIGIELAQIHRFEFTYDLYHDEGDYSPRPDMNGEINAGLSGDLLLPTVYQRNTLTLRYQLTTESHKGKASLYSTETEIERDESQTGWSGRNSINTATNNNSGLNALFQSNFVLVSLADEISYGFDYMDKSSTSEYGGVEFMDESAISSALFAENKLYLTNNWSVTTGLRYDDYQRKAETGSHHFDEFTWSLATHWDINTNWALFASARSLFKGPELLETYVKYQDVAYLADDIKAETGINSQIGFSYHKQTGKHNYGLNFSAFNTDIDDHISETWAYNPTSVTIENEGDIEIRGFELSTTYSYEQFASKLSYAKSDTKDRDTGLPVNNGSGISEDIGDSIALTLDYYADPINTLLGWTSTVVLEEDNVFAGDDNKPGYNVHDFYAQWLPTSVEDLSVTFGIDNIFDEQYTSHASRSGVARGYATDDYEPGRNFKLSVAYQF